MCGEILNIVGLEIAEHADVARLEQLHIHELDVSGDSELVGDLGARAPLTTRENQIFRYNVDQHSIAQPSRVAGFTILGLLVSVRV